MQTEVRVRRNRKSEDNLSIQYQIQQKHEMELEKLRASVSDNGFVLLPYNLICFLAIILAFDAFKIFYMFHTRKLNTTKVINF